MSAPAVGIDLGTTYSALAVINPAGKPEIVPNADGDRLTASAVLFEGEARTLVGQEAVAAAISEPDRVVRGIKRHMGDPEWRFEADGQRYRPEDISAIILRKIKQDAEITLGPIRHAVITVPAYFDETRRKATMDAAERAGLEPLRIINEPTAAAIAHAASGQVRGTCLMYDLGGGTFDVSIVRINPPYEVDVLASDGDHQLGGIDFDRALAKHYAEVFRREKDARLADDAGSVEKVEQDAEKAKRSLSSRQKVRGDMLRGSMGETMPAQLNREEFNSFTRDLVVRTEMLVENALADAQIQPEDIDEILLVGGSTRIPAIQDMLRNKFNKEPKAGVSVDEAVALGAAIQAGVVMQERGLIELPETAAERIRSTRIHEITNQSLGTLAVADTYGRQRMRNTILIPKNTPIPVSKTETFYTMRRDQDSIVCEVTQGEDEDPEFVKVLIEDSLGLPSGRPEGCAVEVCFSYDADGRFRGEFRDVESGRTKSFDLDLADNISGQAGELDDIDAADLDDLLID